MSKVKELRERLDSLHEWSSCREVWDLHLDVIEESLKFLEKVEKPREDLTSSQEPNILANMLETSEEQKNKAYSERNRAVIMFAKIANRLGLRAGVGLDDNTSWDDEWGNVVYIDLPEGQVSWHIAPSEVHLLEGLPKYEGEWDGTYRKNEDNFIKGIKI